MKHHSARSDSCGTRHAQRLSNTSHLVNIGPVPFSPRDAVGAAASQLGAGARRNGDDEQGIGTLAWQGGPLLSRVVWDCHCASHIGTLHPANGQALSAGLRRDLSGGPGLAAGRAGRDRLACRGTACLVACACGRDSHLLCGGQEPRSRGCRGSVGIGLVGHDDTRRLGALRLFQKGVSSAMPQASDQPVPRDAGDHQRHRGAVPALRAGTGRDSFRRPSEIRIWPINRRPDGRRRTDTRMPPGRLGEGTIQMRSQPNTG